MLIVKINLDQSFKFLTDSHGLGITGETFVANQDQLTKKIILFSPLRNDPGAVQKLFNADSKEGKIILPPKIPKRNPEKYSREGREKIKERLKKFKETGDPKYRAPAYMKDLHDYENDREFYEARVRFRLKLAEELKKEKIIKSPIN